MDGQGGLVKVRVRGRVPPRLAAVATIALLVVISLSAASGRPPDAELTDADAAPAATAAPSTDGSGAGSAGQRTRSPDGGFILIGAILLIAVFELGAVRFGADSRERRLNDYARPMGSTRND